MQVDIFIRTYHKDLPWLAHALRSIHSKVTGWRRIIIAIPKGQGHLLSHLTAETVIEVDDLEDGYIGQQLTKMKAWRYTDADAVVFWDSDVVASEPHDIMEEYFSDGKPILYCTPWEHVGDAICWKGCTTEALGWEPPMEYMRRMPIVHRTDALAACCVYICRQHGLTMTGYMMTRARFSEFNAIGAYVAAYMPRLYDIRDTTKDEVRPSKIRQFWSWGGFTDEVNAQLEQL